MPMLRRVGPIRKIAVCEAKIDPYPASARGSNFGCGLFGKQNVPSVINDRTILQPLIASRQSMCRTWGGGYGKKRHEQHHNTKPRCNCLAVHVCPSYGDAYQEVMERSQLQTLRLGRSRQKKHSI